MALLQPLQRRLHLLLGPVAAHPKTKLPAAGRLQLGQLYAQLGDRRPRLPLLEPPGDKPEELDAARERVPDQRFTLLGAGVGQQPDANALGAGSSQTELAAEVLAEG